MEKIQVRIGHPGHGSKASIVYQDETQKIEFLRKCFKISHQRASLLVRQLDKGAEGKFTTSTMATVTLNYEQLARYTAFRQVDGLNTFWKYPHVLEIIEEDEVTPDTVIELRPSYRRIGN